MEAVQGVIACLLNGNVDVEALSRAQPKPSRPTHSRQGSRAGLLRCPVLCCAVSCHAVLCHALSCQAVLCCAVLCRVVPRRAVLCCAVLCCAVLCCAVLCCAVLCRAVQYKPVPSLFHHCPSCQARCGVLYHVLPCCPALSCLAQCSAELCCAVGAVQPNITIVWTSEQAYSQDAGVSSCARHVCYEEQKMFRFWE